MKLLFVYNADSGVLSSVLNSAHKVLSPGTYSCSLCALTHGALSERAIWKAFRTNSHFESVFLHRDEFERQYRSKWLPKYTYPVVLEAGNEGLQLLIGSEELAALDSPEALIELISSRTTPG